MQICYRIYYKVLQTLSPNDKLVSFAGTTTLVQTNLLSSKVAINRLIKWEEINFPEVWNQPQETDPEPILNQDIDQIIQTTEGDVETKFTPQHIVRIPRSFSSRSYSRSIPFIPHRASSSQPQPVEVESSDTVETIRLSRNQIPQEIYQRESNFRTSPTPSDMSFHND